MRSLIAFSLLAFAPPPLPEGVSVMVLRPGQATEKYPSAKTTSATNYRLASVTKHMTAAAVLALVDAGRLTPETKLRDVWPEFAPAITVRHLLGHQSGLVDYEDFLPAGTGQVKDAEVIEILRRHPETKFAPGSKFEYSNSGYVVLGMMVEKLSGRSFREFLAETFFGPLKMDCVAHEEGVTRVPHRAYGRPKDQSRTSATLGDGGVYCSLDGLEKWLGSKFALDERMLTPRLGDYGLGWFIKGDRIWHTGETSGFRNAIVIDRRTQVKVVVLANRSDVDARKIAEAMLAR